MTETIEEAKIQVNPAFAEHEKAFLEIEIALGACRTFIEKHREALSRITCWRCYGWDKEIKFSTYHNDAKFVAKLFGASGWTREHDRYSCGAVNWKKELDGMTLLIEGAENIKPKLNEQVKFATID